MNPVSLLPHLVYVFNVSGYVWVRNGVQILSGLRSCCYVVPLQLERRPFKISTSLRNQTQLDTVNTHIANIRA